MRTSSPGAFFASLALHAAFVGGIVLAAYLAAQRNDTPPVIFEMVAGPPTAPDELVAPALGNSLSPVKIETPKPEAVAPEPVKPAEVQPKEESMPEVTTAKPVTAKPKPVTSIAKELRKSERVSYKDYLKKHPIPKEPKQVAANHGGAVPRIDAQGIAEGVKGGSTANTRGGGGGKALTREEQNEMDTYISFLISELHAAHEPPPGVSDKLVVLITFDISADGTISNPRIARSSGNREFDESAIDAFRRIHPIGPTPNGRGDTWTVNFRMKENE